VADIEARLHERAEKEITSREVGELVMDHLKRLDQVAYVRFASVYKAFQDVSQFSETVNQLQGLLDQKAKPVVAAVPKPRILAKTKRGDLGGFGMRRPPDLGSGGARMRSRTPPAAQRSRPATLFDNAPSAVLAFARLLRQPAATEETP